MDIQTITAFIEVAHHKSFSLAAETLFITQPAISKRITALETSLGVRLFNRIGRRISLTEAGRALLPRVQALRTEIEDIRRFASNLSGGINGLLTMGTSHHIGLHRLPLVLQSFKTDYPDVQLDIHFEDSEQACHAIERGDLELAVVTLPEQVSRQTEVHTLWIDHLHIVVSTRHPLAQMQSVDLGTLMRFPCILPSRDTYTYHILQRSLEPLGLRPDVQMSTNYLETLKMLVSSGFGWSLLPHTMLDSHIAALNTPLKLQRRLGTVIHTRRTLSNAAEAMLYTLAQFADSSQPPVTEPRAWTPASRP
ncbi:MAG: LysR family transcriptional regulator [Thiothrix sp.]|nr:LysR family transcriptional regulator [Thiothrix sp.]HPE61173.1 LysR family transcriptional regulator [Thiolinea sp.]